MLCNNVGDPMARRTECVGFRLLRFGIEAWGSVTDFSRAGHVGCQTLDRPIRTFKFLRNQVSNAPVSCLTAKCRHERIPLFRSCARTLASISNTSAQVLPKHWIVGQLPYVIA